MATSTYYPASTNAFDAAKKQKSGSVRGFWKRLMEKRDAKARRQAALFLANTTDEKLVSYGWSQRDIERLRRG